MTVLACFIRHHADFKLNNRHSAASGTSPFVKIDSAPQCFALPGTSCGFAFTFARQQFRSYAIAPIISDEICTVTQFLFTVITKPVSIYRIYQNYNQSVFVFTGLRLLESVTVYRSKSEAKLCLRVTLQA